MTLSEKSRHEFYETLRAMSLGEEATNQVLSYFPARDVEEPVTKEFLRSELALSRLELREELETFRTEFRTELRGEMNTFRTDLRAEMGTLGADLRDEMNTLRTELRGEMNTLASGLRSDMGTLNTELRDEMGTLASGLRSEMGTLNTELRGEMGTLKGEMDEMRRGITALGSKIDGVSTQSTIATAELRTEIHAELGNQLITIIMAMIGMVGAMAAVQHWM